MTGGTGGRPTLFPYSQLLLPLSLLFYVPRAFNKVSPFLLLPPTFQDVTFLFFSGGAKGGGKQERSVGTNRVQKNSTHLWQIFHAWFS